MTFTKEQLNLIAVALSYAGHGSRQEGQTQQADEFSGLAAEVRKAMENDTDQLPQVAQGDDLSPETAAMLDVCRKAQADNHHCVATFCFNELAVTVKGLPAQLLWALVKAGHKADGLVLRNDTTEGVRQLRVG